MDVMLGQGRTKLSRWWILKILVFKFGGRDSVLGIATRYILNGPGIGSQWRRDFPRPSRPTLEPLSPCIVEIRSLSLEQSDRGVDYPPASSAEVEECVLLFR